MRTAAPTLISHHTPRVLAAVHCESRRTLEAKLLELALANATSDTSRAAQVRALVMDAAVAGSFGAIRRLLEAKAAG